MAQRVFHPLEQWPTKDANAFMVKNLNLVTNQKKELESDLQQDEFLRDYKKVLGYKPAFKFKSKMQASMRSQRTSLVPLFMLADEDMKVKEMWKTHWLDVGLPLLRMITQRHVRTVNRL